MHSPERVTFLLVDYKGGAAFKECVALPHTVGMVTDLDRNEVRRALMSLNAELHHRELLLQEADAKDLLEMERKGHPDTPPSLLIVVDEFAALAKEIPEFVDGVVDVAQRGRSLGLHLVLATQRPAGVITDQIRANTNLRIALRMAADDESADVVGSPVAAAIERRLPGRAVARIGPQELVSFQSAYVGGHTMANVQAPMARVRIFGFDHDTAIAEERRVVVPPDHPSDLQRLVANNRRRVRPVGAATPRRPWLPSLAASYELGRLPRPKDDLSIVLGVRDEPARQLQALASFRPDTDGGLLVLGTGGSGKTVALRSIAISAGLAAEASGHPVEVHAVDFAGRGLDVLEGLPHVGSVIAGDDTERVTRLLRTLRERIDQRAVDFAAVRARPCRSTAAAPRRDDDEPDHRAARQLPRLPGDARTDRGRALARPVRPPRRRRPAGRRALRDHGRSSDVGADGARQRAAPAARVAAVERRRVQQRRRADGDPVGHEPARAGHHRRPGGADRRARRVGQRRAPGARDRPARRPPGRRGDRCRTGRRRAARRAAPRGARRRVDAGAAGVRDGRRRPRPPSAVVRSWPCARHRAAASGKTTALASIAQAAAAARLPVFHVHVRPTAFGHAPFWGKVARGPEEGAALLERVAEAVPQLGKRVVIVVDDLGELVDSEADNALLELLRLGREHPVTIVASCDNTAARRQYSGTIPELRKDGRAVLLQPDTDNDGDLVGVNLPRRTRGAWPEGHGYLADRGSAELIQVALPDPW